MTMSITKYFKTFKHETIMLLSVLFIKLTKIVLDKTQLRPIMGIWVNAILIHINMKLNIPIIYILTYSRWIFSSIFWKSAKQNSYKRALK